MRDLVKLLTTSNRRCIYDIKNYENHHAHLYNIIDALKDMRKYLKKMKLTDEYVRGYKDAQSIMDETLERTIDIIEFMQRRLEECEKAYSEAWDEITFNRKDYPLKSQPKEKNND